ncbi:MAG: flippase-like domain-containing protein [Bacilli bacterium]|nr:flippase-like domain-containing protein [Bacilli bacterium]
MKSEKILKRSLISIVFFTIFVSVVFYFIFKENNLLEIINIFKNSNKIYLIIAIICMSLFSVCEALNLKTAFTLFKDKVKFFDCYKYALSGYFICSITPSSAGGDPVQFYLMTKDKISISHGAIVLLTKLLAFQLVTILLAAISFLLSRNIFSSFGNLKYLIYLGIFLNFLVFTTYILVIFYKKIVMFLVEKFTNLLLKFKYKNALELKEKLYLQVDEYQHAATILKKNKLVFLRIVLITIIQMLLYYSIPYFVYLALGLNGANVFSFISIQAVLFVSVSSLPFPGAVGITETAFMHLYKNLFTENLLGSAMVITRFINFYIFVFYSGIMFLIFMIKDNLKKRDT